MPFFYTGSLVQWINVNNSTSSIQKACQRSEVHQNLPFWQGGSVKCVAKWKTLSVFCKL